MDTQKIDWRGRFNTFRPLIVVNAVILIINIVLILTHCAIDEKNLWNWGWIILSFQIVFNIFSFGTVGPDEKAAVLLFGRPLYEVSSGLVFVPWLICSLRRESRLTIQMQIPGEPEEIDKSGNDEKGVVAGKVLPIRATTGSYETAKKFFADDPSLVDGDPLNLRMTLEPTAQILFKIKDIVKFIRHIGSISEAKKQLRDTAEGAIKNEFAKRTPALIISHWSEINVLLKKEIGNLVKDDPLTPGHDEGWGVEVETAQLLDVDITKKVNEALSLVTEATIKKTKTVIDAVAAKEAKIEEGYGLKSFKTSEGEGLAKARELLLLAEAVGMQKLAELAQTPQGQLTMIVQQAKEMYEKSKYSIIPGNGDGLLGTIAGIQEVLKKIKGPDDKKDGQ